MSRATTDLLLHPVRMRIINALSGGQPLSTSELCDRLREFGQATVYRQVARLKRGGIIEVQGESRVRGATERRYQLRPDRARITQDDAAAMTIDEHRRAFTASMAALIAEFNAYLDLPGANPFADGVGYRNFVLWLDPAEHAELFGAVGKLLLARIGNVTRPGRLQYRMSPIAFPREPARASDETAGPVKRAAPGRGRRRR